MIPQTFGSAEVSDLAHYVDDRRYAVEQKLDGTRALVEVKATGVRFLGRNGGPLKHAAAAQHFDRLARALEPLRAYVEATGADAVILDGEILTDTGELWLFDAPQVPGAVTPRSTFAARRSALEELGSLVLTAPVMVTRSAFAPADKAALIAAVETAGAEGVMVKDVGAPYEPGKRVKHSFKVKYVKTADVVVTARNVNGACNAELAVYDDAGNMVPIGGCSMIGKPDAQPGEVVEVRYLYLGSGARLYQPTLMRLRPDREPASCRFDQFRMVSKAVVR